MNAQESKEQIQKEILGTWLSKDDPNLKVQFLENGLEIVYHENVKLDTYKYEITSKCGEYTDSNSFYLKSTNLKDSNDFDCEYINAINNGNSGILSLSLVGRGKLDLYTKQLPIDDKSIIGTWKSLNTSGESGEPGEIVEKYTPLKWIFTKDKKCEEYYKNKLIDVYTYSLEADLNLSDNEITLKLTSSNETLVYYITYVSKDKNSITIIPEDSGYSFLRFDRENKRLIDEGLWQYSADSLSTVKIKGDKWTFLYKGIERDSTDIYEYKIVNEVKNSERNLKGDYLLLIQNTDTLKYEIDELTKKDLTLIYLSRGNFHFYTKK